MTPKTIANYKILKELGTGGMGTVYLAENLSIGSKVAIKMLHPHLVKSENIKTRFLKEAKTQAILDHPNITKVIDFVSNDQGLFIILEFVEGEPLNDFLFKTKGLLPEKEANHYMAKILDAVAYAHSKGIVHRDLKTANIMVTPNKGIKIMDFGIAKLANETMSLTKTGSRLGSPLYMSPEQVTNGNVDFRSDIYSLGVVYHEMLTGTPVYDQNNTTEFEIYSKIVKQALPRLRGFYKLNSDEAQETVDAATAKLPAARFQSCSEFKNTLLNGTHVPRSAMSKIGAPAVERRKFTNKKTASREKPSKENHNMSIIAGILIAIIVLGGAIFYFSSNKDQLSEKLTISTKQAESLTKEGNFKKAYEAYQSIISEQPENELAKERLNQLATQSELFQKRSVDSILQRYLQTSSLENFQPNDSLLAYKITTGRDHIYDELRRIAQNPKVVGDTEILSKSMDNLKIANLYFHASSLYQAGNLEEAVTVLKNARQIGQNSNVDQLQKQISLSTVTSDSVAIKKYIAANNKPIPFSSVQTPPLFPGCVSTGTQSQKTCFENKLTYYLKEGIKSSNYKNLGHRAGIQTNNYSFVIGKDGLVRNIVIESPNQKIEKDIRDRIKNLRGIKPGFQNYVPVDVVYTGTYSFRINNRDGQQKNKLNEESIVETQLEDPHSNIPKNISMEMADRAPAFPGCENESGKNLRLCTSNKINNFISRNINYQMLSRAGLPNGQRKVFLKFRITDWGSIQNISVSAPKDMPQLHEEVTRVIKLLPQMRPGTYQGETVAIDYNVGLIVTIK